VLRTRLLLPLALCLGTSALVVTPASAQAQTDAVGYQEYEAVYQDEEPAWHFSPVGYVRTGVQLTQRDDDVDFIGRNNGFYIAHARLGLNGRHDDAGVSFRLSFDGALDSDRSDVNTPEGSLEVGLRDAYIRYAPGVIALQLGQFKAPFTRESMRSTGRLPFINRSVGEAGIAVGTGYELPGLNVSRQQGLMLSTDGVLEAGLVYLAAYAMVANGSGSNDTLNDNSRFGFFARGQVGFLDIVTLGLSGHLNDRTVDRFIKEDRTWAVDVNVHWIDFDFYAEYISQITRCPTTGTQRRLSQAFSAQLNYGIAIGEFMLTPGYRFATFNPSVEAESPPGEPVLRGVNTHTIALQGSTDLDSAELGLQLEYIIMGEDDGREVDNNIFQALARVAF
jgi:hypothetical protein